MPWDSMPRSLARLILRPPGRRAPRVATGYPLPGGDIGGTADDLLRLALAKVNAADAELGGVRVGLDRLDPPDAARR
jgi:hypothetical protein